MADPRESRKAARLRELRRALRAHAWQSLVLACWDVEVVTQKILVGAFDYDEVRDRMHVNGLAVHYWAGEAVGAVLRCPP